MKSLAPSAFLTFALLLTPAAVRAQDRPAEKPDSPAPEGRLATPLAIPYDTRISDCSQQPTRTQGAECERVRDRHYTIYLRNISQQNDANEVLVALRNLLDPATKIFLVASQAALEIRTYPEQFARAEAIVKALDRPHKVFRITYTITDLDGDRRVGTQHFSMTVADGQRSTLKQGSKIPVATGKTDDGKGTPGSVQTSFTYLDIGINLDASITASVTSLHIKSKVEQSSAAPEPAIIAGVSEPIIRQSVIDQVSDIVPGKPTILGSIDVAGTTHRLDVAVTVDPLT